MSPPTPRPDTLVEAAVQLKFMVHLAWMPSPCVHSPEGSLGFPPSRTLRLALSGHLRLLSRSPSQKAGTQLLHVWHVTHPCRHTWLTRREGVQGGKSPRVLTHPLGIPAPWTQEHSSEGRSLTPVPPTRSFRLSTDPKLRPPESPGTLCRETGAVGGDSPTWPVRGTRWGLNSAGKCTAIARRREVLLQIGNSGSLPTAAVSLA